MVTKTKSTEPAKEKTGETGLTNHQTATLKALKKLKTIVKKKVTRAVGSAKPTIKKKLSGKPPIKIPEGNAEAWKRPQEEYRGLIENCLQFLAESPSEEIRSGRMPGEIESHAEIAPLTEPLRQGYAGAMKGNRIVIDCSSPETKERLMRALEKSGGAEERANKLWTHPAGLLQNMETVCKAMAAENKPAGIGAAKLGALSKICMAYLEILEEESVDPELRSGAAGTARRWDPQIAASKEALLDQHLEGTPHKDTPPLTQRDFEEKVRAECQTGITTQEAVQVAVILAEREITGLRKSRKRETLFTIRARLCHHFFEETKKFRCEGHSADRILSQKPRYKTPCIFFASHPGGNRTKVEVLAPASPLGYWGNPEAEKEAYAIIKHENQNTGGGMKAAINNPTTKKLARWILALITAQALLIVGVSWWKGSPHQRKQPEPAAGQGQSQGSAKKAPARETKTSLEW